MIGSCAEIPEGFPFSVEYPKNLDVGHHALYK